MQNYFLSFFELTSFKNITVQEPIRHISFVESRLSIEHKYTSLTFLTIKCLFIIVTHRPQEHIPALVIFF